MLVEEERERRVDNTVCSIGGRHGTWLTVNQLPAAVANPGNELVHAHVVWHLAANGGGHRAILTPG
jgi:hypothetical protein